MAVISTSESAKELRTEITSKGKLKLSIASIDMPMPSADQVLIRVEATPINPSDLILLIGPADINTLKVSGKAASPEVTMDISAAMMSTVAARLDQSLPVGNEGAGTVVAAGKNVHDFIGKVVGVAGGAMYTEYRCVPASSCLVMHPGTTPAESASCFVNPLTVLGMIETMRMENHTALVHTAAASNLGQMLVKVCLADKVPLVNIVRKPAQVELLKSIGAKYICNSADDDFMDQLVAALIETGATLGFDATGGGKLASQILAAMEISANKAASEYNRYGSDTYKQVYIYGGLDRSVTTLNRAFGMCWGLGGWLLTPLIRRVGTETFRKMRQRVTDEINTTFASTYTQEISLAQALSADTIRTYAKQATGEKFLITPHK